MPPVSSISTTPQTAHTNYRIPEGDDAETDYLAFRDRWFSYYNVYRNRHLQRIARSLNYYIGRQWLEIDTSILSDGVRGYALKAVTSKGEYEMPRPVTNYVGLGVDAEMAVLSRREFVPAVIPNSSDPRVISAAREAKRVLLSRLQQLDWPSIRDEASFQDIVCGTAILKSWWDETFVEMVRVPSPEAVSCPSCRAKLSSIEVPLTMTQANPNMLGLESATEGSEPDMMKLSRCPACGELGLEESPLTTTDLDANDVLGRPLGLELPKGNTNIEVVSPFDYFPENGGVDISSHPRLHGQATPRSVDWIEERYPSLKDKIDLEAPNVLMQLHPLLGEWDIVGRYNMSLDSGIYDHHTRVFEIHSEKTLRHPEGRSLIIIGNEVIVNDSLYKTIDTKQFGKISVPRTKYAIIRFKRRHREFWGQSLVDDLISPQNRVNGIDSQIIEARDRMGVPNLMASEAMDLSGPEYFDEYGGGKIMRYTTDPLDPGGRPQVFGGITMPEGAVQERAACVGDIRTLAGPTESEAGENPAGVSTVGALQLLGENAERKRTPRERPITAAFEEIWSHQLDLIWALRADEDEYEFEDEDGSWQRKQFNRSLILGQTRVKLEKQAYVDKGLLLREGAREGQSDGLYRLDSQAAIKKLLEHRGLPTDVNEDSNKQVDLAERRWVDFVEDGRVPVIDYDLDDPTIHFQVLGKNLLSDKSRNLMDKLGWDQLLRGISGWEVNLEKALALHQQALDFYGGYIPQEQADEIYAKQILMLQQQAAAPPQLDPATGAPLPPPEPPPPPKFLPPCLEDQIMVIWQGLLQSRGMIPNGDQGKLLQFMAVVRAYKMISEKKQQEAAAGMQQQAAPQGGSQGA